MRHIRLLAFLISAACALFPLAASAGDGVEKVTLQLKWKHQFQFAGYYAAQKKGFYRDESLDVTIVEGHRFKRPVEELLSGRAQYAVHNTEALLDFLAGEPVMALAAIFQHSPSLLLTRSDANINTPRDLIGRRVMLVWGAEAEVEAMLLRNGISRKDIVQQPHTWTVEPLLDGRTDALTGYASNEPWTAKRRGVPVNVLNPRAHGVNFYGDCLFTTRTEADLHPDRVERFVRASLRGWEYAMRHPEEIADLILAEYAPGKTRDQLLYEAEVLREYILPDLVEIGTMSLRRWQHIADTYASLGMASPGNSLKNFLYDPKDAISAETLRTLIQFAVFLALLGASLIAMLYWFNLKMQREIDRRTHDLHESETKFRAIFELSPYAISIQDRGTSNYLEVNQAFLSATGFTLKDVLGKTPLELGLFSSPKDYARLRDRFGKDGQLTNEDVQIRTRDGSALHILFSTTPVTLKGRACTLTVTTDITPLKENERSLRLASQVFAQSREAIVITDPQGVIVDVNRTFTDMTGFTSKEAVGRTPGILKSDRHSEKFYRDMWRTLTTKGWWRGEVWDRKKNGELFPCWLSISALRGEGGQVENYIGTIADLSEEKKSAESIYRLNYHDILTELPNRALFLERLSQEIKHATQSGRAVGVMVLDLDGFKTVNESLGIDAGDELLQIAARRLTDAFARRYTVARLGSDEFALMYPGLDDLARIVPLIQKVQTQMHRPYALEKGEAFLTCSIGVGLFPEDASDTNTLMQAAENALHHARQQGPGNYQFFSGEMTSRASERLELSTALHRALELKQFELHYQPKVDTTTGQTIGAEALIRWRHPKRGIVPPDAFIPLLEESDLIHSAGEWVLREACGRCRSLLDIGFGDIRMAVNVSPRQILDQSRDLPALVETILGETHLGARHLELEITEAALVHDNPHVLDTLARLKDIGVTLAVDDFGTGYSSLSYLSKFPIDTLKIDRSFVRDLETSRDSATLASAIIAMGRSLGLAVVAEGAENREQIERLKRMGCTTVQGFHYSPPLPDDQFVRFLGR